MDSDDNSLVLCYSWYLDSFCKWDAIILDDYSGAIALPKRTKLGIKQLYQPSFIQKCIWFGSKLTREQLQKISIILKENFSSIHFNTNLPILKQLPRTNLVLDVTASIANIKKRYSRSLRKNLKKIDANIYTEEIDANVVIDLYKKVWGAQNPQLKTHNYQKLLNTIKSNEKHFLCIGAKKNETCLAGVILAIGKNRSHYILGASSAAGKKENALSFLIDHIICNGKSEIRVFDFEGSSIPSVKSYYETFGTIDEPFLEITHDHHLIAMAKKIYSKFTRS